MLDETKIRTWLIQTAQRDQNAFENLYHETASLVFGVILRLVQRRELAEEILHDAYMRIWQKADLFDPTSTQAVGWVVTIARNRALDVLSSADVSRVSTVGTSEDGSPSSWLDELMGTDDYDPSVQEATRRDNQHLNRCITRLESIERQVIGLAFFHGLSHQEMADHLQKPLGSVKTWVRRGMQNLKTCIEKCRKEQ